MIKILKQQPIKKIKLLLSITTAICITNLSSQNLQWAKSFGNNDIDYSYSVAVDASGNVYTAGSFYGTVDFDPGAGTFDLTSNGFSDIFISKLDANGNFVWAKNIGGVNMDEPYAITLDNSGNIYITGYFRNTVDFDPGAGNFDLTSIFGSNDIFICKLNANGDFVWAKSMGNTGSDYGRSIVVDNSGNTYVTGNFSGTVDFDPGAGTSNLSSAGNLDVFVTKLNPNGDFLWAKNMGGTSIDEVYSLAVDASGNVHITGYFNGTADFDPGAGTSNLTASGSYDIFVCKLDANGDFIWAKNMGGNFTDEGRSIALDNSGNVYTTGYFSMTADFDPGVNTFNLNGAGEDIFISKLDVNGNFVWAKKIGGTGQDRGFSLAKDAYGSLYITGYFTQTVDFDPGPNTFNLTSMGSDDIFICELDTTGNFVWAGNMGGTSGDYGYSLTVDAINNVFVTGYFQGTCDFNPGAGTLNLTSAGSVDVFIAKLASCSPVSTIQNGATITANISGASYQWIDCNNGNAPISGATNQSFTPTVSGSYAVIVILGGCNDTSACVNVTINSIGNDDNNKNKAIFIYPNPATNNLNIKLEQFGLLEVYSIDGKLIESINTITNNYTLDINQYTNGMYFVKFSGNDGNLYQSKFIKQ